MGEGARASERLQLGNLVEAKWSLTCSGGRGSRGEGPHSTSTPFPPRPFRLLDADERNFHGWNYRRFVLEVGQGLALPAGRGQGVRHRVWHIAMATQQAAPSRPQPGRTAPAAVRQQSAQSWSSCPRRVCFTHKPLPYMHSIPLRLPVLHLQLMGTPAERALDYTRKKIDQNFSNYSAWHSRTVLLPVAHGGGEAEVLGSAAGAAPDMGGAVAAGEPQGEPRPAEGQAGGSAMCHALAYIMNRPGLGALGAAAVACFSLAPAPPPNLQMSPRMPAMCLLPRQAGPAAAGEGTAAALVPKEVLDEEYELVKQAFYTEPEDQSGWFYHRWLLGAPPFVLHACGRAGIQACGGSGGGGRGGLCFFMATSWARSTSMPLLAAGGVLQLRRKGARTAALCAQVSRASWQTSLAALHTS